MAAADIGRVTTKRQNCHTLDPTAHNVHPEPNVLQVLLYALHPDPETVEARVT